MKQTVKSLTKTLFGLKMYFFLYKLYKKTATTIYQSNLNSLAELYGSDKYGFHFYTEQYMKLFLPLRKQNLKILEIGIGGFDDPDKGGASLLMWQKFFPNAYIFGLDIYDKSRLNSKRIKTFRGSQVDKEYLTNMLKTTGKLDIIIDDGSHIPLHNIESFKFLFPFLNPGGYYIVEDTLSSYNSYYHQEHGQNSNFLNFAKNLTDYVNYRADAPFLPDQFEMIKNQLSADSISSIVQELEFVTFHEQLVVIKKR